MELAHTEGALGTRWLLKGLAKKNVAVRGNDARSMKSYENIYSFLHCRVSNIRQYTGQELVSRRSRTQTVKNQVWWSPLIVPSTFGKKGQRFSCVETATLPKNGSMVILLWDRSIEGN